MTAEVRKSVVYSAVLSDRHLKSSVRKAVAYSAVLSDRHLKSSVRKVAAYAVVFPHNNGDVVQPDPDLRPIYQGGSVPYIDFAGGKSFTVEIPETSVYTLLVLRTDLTFDRVRRVMFTEGVNNIILTGQVAQFRYLKGDPTPQQIEDFKEEMLSFYANLTAPLEPPAPFAGLIPFNIYKTGPQSFQTDFDPEDYMVDSDVTYYLSPEGDDGNDGLTPSQPKKSIGALVQLLNSDPPGTGATFYLEAGTYNNLDSLVGVAFQFDCNMICPEGKAVLTHTRQPEWSKSPSWDFVWTAPIGTSEPIITVADLSDKDSYGIGKRLRLVSSTAEVEATPGSLFIGSTTLAVRLHDDRDPDDLLVALVDSGSPIWSQGSSHSIFMQGISFQGGSVPVRIGSPGGNYIFDGCEFLYSRTNENGFETNGVLTANALTIMNNCIAAYNGRDGFSYRGAHLAVEIGCLGVWNGYTQANANDNGSTAHNNVVTARVGGEYSYNDDRNVHDVNNTKNWMVGCTAGFAQNGSSDPYDNANFICGSQGTAVLTQSWMEGCTSLGGSASDVVSAGASVANTLECSGFDKAFELDDGTIADADPGAWPADRGL